jgi:PTS system mannose-specific IIA component
LERSPVGIQRDRHRDRGAWRLAREYLAAVEHVVGKQRASVAISIEADTTATRQAGRDLRRRRRVDTGDGVVVVTDMFGGSPSNLSLPACRRSDRKILYGANLPMLIKLAKSRHKPCPTPWPARWKRGGNTSTVSERSGRALVIIGQIPNEHDP